MAKNKKSKVNKRKIIVASVATTGLIGATLGVVLPLTLNNRKTEIQTEPEFEIIQTTKVPKIKKNKSVFIPNRFMNYNNSSLDETQLKEIDNLQPQMQNVASEFLEKKEKNLDSWLNVQPNIYVSRDKKEILYIYNKTTNKNKKIKIHFNLEKILFEEIVLGEVNEDNLVLIDHSLKEHDEIVKQIFSSKLTYKLNSVFDELKTDRFNSFDQNNEDISFKDEEEKTFAKDVTKDMFNIPENNFVEILIESIEDTDDGEVKVAFVVISKNSLSDGTKLEKRFEIIYSGFKSYNKHILNSVEKSDFLDLFPTSDISKKVENISKPENQTFKKDGNDLNIEFSKWEKQVDKINWEAIVSFGNEDKLFVGSLKGFEKPYFPKDNIEQANRDKRELNVTISLQPWIKKEERTALSIKKDDLVIKELNNSKGDFQARITSIEPKKDSNNTIFVNYEIYSKKISEDDVPTVFSEIEISGFATLSESEQEIAYVNEQNRKDLFTKVMALNESSLQLINLDKEQWPSLVDESKVIKAIKLIDGLEGLEDSTISVTSNDEEGTLTIAIFIFGEDKVINLHGFKNIMEQLKRDVPNLTSDSFTFSEKMKNKLPSEITTSEIAEASGLKINPKNIFLEANDSNSSLKVAIKNYGEIPIKVTLTGFASSKNRAKTIFNNDFSFAKWQELVEKASVFKAKIDGESKSFETWEELEKAIVDKKYFDYATVTFEYKDQEELDTIEGNYLIPNQRIWNYFVDQQQWTHLFKKQAKEKIIWKDGKGIIEKAALRGKKEDGSELTFDDLPDKGFEIPYGIEIISKRAFSSWGDKFYQVKSLPNTTKEISSYVFWENKINENFSIPKLITSIHFEAFYDSYSPEGFVWFNAQDQEQLGDINIPTSAGWYLAKDPEIEKSRQNI